MQMRQLAPLPRRPHCLAGRVDCPQHARWRSLLDRVQAGLLPAGAGALQAVPAADARKLNASHKAGKLAFFGEHAHLDGADAFAAFLAPLKKTKWFVYSKRPFSGPKAVLAYLSRYTHRVAISNRRLIAADKRSVTFTYKDYRIEGPGRYKAMTLETGEFIRRFLIHVLPKGFHRIRHYGLLASGARADNLATMRALLAMAAPASQKSDAAKAGAQAPHALVQPCPCCGGRMLIIETFEGSCRPRPPPPGAIRIGMS